MSKKKIDNEYNLNKFIDNSAVMIEAVDVSMKFNLGIEKGFSIKQWFVDLGKNKKKRKNDFWALKDVNFKVNKGEVIGFIGSNGAGKSTLLNIIDELDKNYNGTIIKDNLKMSYMLQSDALLPWLSVLDNACLGLKLEKNLTKDNIEYVKKLIKKFGLESFMNQKTNNLSGGMKQRVALIRTLATKPDLILLDEPLSALDYVTRLTITDEIYSILKEMNVTVILISHDIAECVSFCNRIVVLSKRPAIIKNIYNINLEKNLIPYIYYDLIWGDLDK